MLWPLFFLVTAIHAELCHPDAENAFKVRLSIRSALGEKAYVWDTDEEYLFRAMVAFSMRKVPNRESTEMNRNRINSAFFLDDHTLEFLKIPSTLAPPTDPSVPVWIIVFGVIFCIVIVAIALLVLSGIRQRQRKNKGPPGVDDAEDKCENIITIENGIPCDPLDTKEGHVNDGFSTEDERLTPL